MEDELRQLRDEVRELRNEVKELRNEVRELRNEVKELRNEVKELILCTKQSNHKMGEHINFVESVYSTVRYPLDYITKRLGYGKDLPNLIENREYKERENHRNGSPES